MQVISMICHFVLQARPDCAGGSTQPRQGQRQGFTTPGKAAAASTSSAARVQPQKKALSLGLSCPKFLVVAPSSVLDNWHMELLRWAPALKVVLYRGSADTRKDIYYDQVSTKNT